MYAFVQVVKASALGRKVSVYSDTSNMKSVMSFRASFAPEMTVCPASLQETKHQAFPRTPYALDTRNGHESSALLRQLSRRNISLHVTAARFKYKN